VVLVVVVVVVTSGWGVQVVSVGIMGLAESESEFFSSGESRRRPGLQKAGSLVRDPHHCFSTDLFEVRPGVAVELLCQRCEVYIWC
jgi:hypothetical protein